MSDRSFDMPPVSAGFDARGGWLLNRLMAEPELGLTNPIHAAAIVGNLGGESGLEAINERHPIEPGSRGGWSWAQWTGSRRDQFEAYAATRGLPLTSDQAAYEFLVKELLGTEAHALQQTKKTTALDAAVYTFEVLFERPSDPEGGLPDRMAFAKKALAAAGVKVFVPALPAIPAQPIEVPVMPSPSPAPPPPQSATFHPKFTASAIGGALALIVITELNRRGITIDGNEGASITLLIGALSAWLAPNLPSE